MGQIQVEMSDTLNKANRLEQIGNEIKNLSAKDLMQIGTTAASVWKGDASNYFQKNFVKYNAKIDKRGQDVVKVAADMKKSVRRLQQIEEYARSIWG